MQNLTTAIVTLLTTIPLSEASFLDREPQDWNLKVSMADYSTHYFDNEIDHFDERDVRTYKQRYWYNDQFFKKEEQGPVFLYICGEWTCTPPDAQMFPMMVGAEHDALLVSLEHRYYGDSQPFDTWTTDNFKYLESEQALADIATFIEGQNKNLGYEADWIVIGGSYPGALSAWFKSQYPDHAVGAWSSSGVIHAIEDFKYYDFDMFIKTDASGPDCSGAIQEAVRIADKDLTTKAGKQRLADLFGIKMPFENADFSNFFTDIFASYIQYGNRVSMCETLTQGAGTPETLMKTIADLAVSEGQSFDGYRPSALSSTKIDINSSSRQWTYQYCNEFGFFATPNEEQPMRSQALNLPYWPDYCKRVFGREIQNKADKTNKHYGGLDITGDNIFFLNGSEDPWQYAGMRQLRHPDTTQKTMTAHYIQCDTCAHCGDFTTPWKGQPQVQTDAQNAVAEEVAKWLSEAQAKRIAALEDVEILQ